MLIPTLLYHDVVAGGEWSASGFTGAGADVYKMDRSDFEAHLRGLEALDTPPSLAGTEAGAHPWRLTFDDGGISSLTEIAPLLEQRGWRGHFFMTSGQIGAPGFLDADGLREMVRRGHVIGSHSVTHPLQMASCSRAQLQREWKESNEQLTEILGFLPTVASIPGGAFSTAVAEAAGEAGIRVLFTSEPTPKSWTVGPVLCHGRYTLWRGMAPGIALQCARGEGIWPRRQWLAWNTRKLAKRALGPAYLGLRSRLLRHAA